MIVMIDQYVKLPDTSDFKPIVPKNANEGKIILQFKTTFRNPETLSIMKDCLLSAGHECESSRIDQKWLNEAFTPIMHEMIKGFVIWGLPTFMKKAREHSPRGFGSGSKRRVFMRSLFDQFLEEGFALKSAENFALSSFSSIGWRMPESIRVRGQGWTTQIARSFGNFINNVNRGRTSHSILNVLRSCTPYLYVTEEGDQFVLPNSDNKNVVDACHQFTNIMNGVMDNTNAIFNEIEWVSDTMSDMNPCGRAGCNEGNMCSSCYDRLYDLVDGCAGKTDANRYFVTAVENRETFDSITPSE